MSGSLVSEISFDTITMLFGDLASGLLYATTDLFGTVAADVFAVRTLDEFGLETSLAALAGGRPDPRFFNFADGSAGVLLEATGEYYRITQISDPAEVPLPLPFLSLASVWACCWSRAERPVED